MQGRGTPEARVSAEGGTAWGGRWAPSTASLKRARVEGSSLCHVPCRGKSVCSKIWHPALTAVPAMFSAAARYVCASFQLSRTPLPLAPSLPFPIASPSLSPAPYPPPPLSHRPGSALQLGMYNSDALEPGKASSATASVPLSVNRLAPLSPTPHTLPPPATAGHYSWACTTVMLLSPARPAVLPQACLTWGPSRSCS